MFYKYTRPQVPSIKRALQVNGTRVYQQKVSGHEPNRFLAIFMLLFCLYLLKRPLYSSQRDSGYVFNYCFGMRPLQNNPVGIF